jgi:DNA-binding response OmpR family regulator
VVDDDQIQCLIVARATAAFNFVTDRATSLDEAIDRISRHGYDVAVLGLSLGEREGISLLRLLFAAQPGGPVVIFNARLDDRVRAASIRFAAGLGLHGPTPRRSMHCCCNMARCSAR